MSAPRTSNAFSPGRFNVWLPGKTKNAFVSFKSADEAQKHVRAKATGVILTPAGVVDPKLQVWEGWAAVKKEVPVVLRAPALAASRHLTQRAGVAPAVPASEGHAGRLVSGKYNVFVPAKWRSDDGPPFPPAYHAFASEAEARAFIEKNHALGVLIDPKGQLAPKQVDPTAAQSVLEMQNDKLTPARVAGKFNVWFPADLLDQIGLQNKAPGFPHGAYIAFDTEKEAAAHAQQRGLGVIVDGAGVAETFQTWPQAMEEAKKSSDLKLPGKSGWVTEPKVVDAAQAKKLGKIDIGGVQLGTITSTAKGADVVAYVSTLNANDAVRFALGAQINGNWMPIFELADRVPMSARGWHEVTVHLDYATVDAYLKTIDPQLHLTPGMENALGVRFETGHDSGIPGWGNGLHMDRDALFKLPPKKA